MRQLTENVFVEDEQSTPPDFHGANTAFVTTDAGVVMVDAPMLPSDAVEWQDRIAAEGDIRYLINTDYHEDHTTGSYFFDAEVVSHARTRQMLEWPPTKVLFGTVEDLLGRELDRDLTRAELTRLRLAERDPDGVSLLGDDFGFRPPTITFTDELAFEVGGTTFELYHLPGHTRGHIGVYVPEEDAFFAGDNVTTGSYPSFVEAVPYEWVETLKRIESFDAEWVVTGHGRVCESSDVAAFRSFLEDQIDFVTNCIAEGMPVEELVEAMEFEGFPPIHADPEYHRQDVERLHEKLFYG